MNVYEEQRERQRTGRAMTGGADWPKDRQMHQQEESAKSRQVKRKCVSTMVLVHRVSE